MTAPRTPRRTTSLAALLGLAALATTSLVLVGSRLGTVGPTAVTHPDRVAVDGWVELAVLGLGGAVALWLLAGTVTALLCALLLRGRRAGERIDAALGRWTPALLRRLARGAVGVGVGAGLALTPVAAHAADPAPAPGPAVVLDLGWQPTLEDSAPEHPAGSTPTGTTATAPGPADQPGTTDVAAAPGSEEETTHDDADRAPDDGSEVVVVRGDTLWDIAARHLPADATDGEILHAMLRWHAANRDVVGDDPDIVLPGQVLRAP